MEVLRKHSLEIEKPINFEKSDELKNVAETIEVLDVLVVAYISVEIEGNLQVESNHIPD